MGWRDAALPDELAELKRREAARDVARVEYRAYYRRLMKRCQSRIKWASSVAQKESE